jgi:hypothetical protein
VDAVTKGENGADLEGKRDGYDANNDTKRGESAGQIPQVVENMVELVGLEPTTSSLRTMRSPN